jgi:hypothetical protein
MTFGNLTAYSDRRLSRGHSHSPRTAFGPWQPTASSCELRLDQIDQLNLGVSQIEYYLQSAALEVVT